MKRLWKNIFVSVLLMLITISCKSCGEKITPEPQKPKQVLLMYLVTDNNGLQEEGIDKFKLIKELKVPSKDYRLLVFYDSQFVTDTGQLIEILPEGSTNIIHEFGDTNSFDKASFRNVLEFVRNNCPADSYGLMLFSHGSGWLPAHAPGTATSGKSLRTVIADNRKELELSDFAGALHSMHFQYIVFEECNMAGVEIAYALRHNADYILASAAQMLSPGFKYLYQSLIDNLFQPTPDYKAFAHSYAAHQDNTHPYYTFSVIRTAPLDNLAKAVQEANRKGLKEVDAKQIQQFDGDTDKPLYFFDFLDYYHQAADKALYPRIEQALRQCVMLELHSPQHYANPEKKKFDTRVHCGLTTYILQGNEMDKEYKGQPWYQAIQ